MVAARMDLLSPVRLGLVPTLHFHATGAVTYLASDEPGWDDEGVLYATPA